MHDYSELIKRNLSIFPGIAHRPEIITFINADLNYLLENNFKKLVDSFCSQKEPDRARDLLFEIWICKMLLKERVQNLFYEPSDSNCPPDFRCKVGGVQFDIQVKRIYNVRNEIAKSILQRECRKRLANNPRAWFINLRISDKLERHHINSFFEYLVKNIHSYTPRPDFRNAFECDYFWELDGVKLVGFSFHEKNKKKPGISIGLMHSGNPGEGMIQRIEDQPYRDAMRRVLKKSKRTFNSAASQQQCNLVIVQPDGELFLEDAEFAADVLYGEDQTVVSVGLNGESTYKDIRGPSGLLKDPNFSNITGVIFVPPSVWIAEEVFKGSYFLNPSHLKDICVQPKIFNSMTYFVLPEWKAKA